VTRHPYFFHSATRLTLSAEKSAILPFPEKTGPVFDHLSDGKEKEDQRDPAGGGPVELVSMQPQGDGKRTDHDKDDEAHFSTP
jgi:hypothetical protein